MKTENLQSPIYSSISGTGLYLSLALIPHKNPRRCWGPLTKQYDQRDKKETAPAKNGKRVKEHAVLHQLAAIQLGGVALPVTISQVSSVGFWKEMMNTRIHVEKFRTPDILLEFAKPLEFRSLWEPALRRSPCVRGWYPRSLSSSVIC